MQLWHQKQAQGLPAARAKLPCTEPQLTTDWQSQDQAGYVTEDPAEMLLSLLWAAGT